MLSIIIPTLNEEDYLQKLLESIKKQTFKDYEIIVADAGSTDKTLEIAKSYNCKVIPGGLPAQGRNEGAKVAKGNILLFIDADIVLPISFLKNALEEFKKRDLGVSGFVIKPIGGNVIDKLFCNLFYTFMVAAGGMFRWAAMVIMTKKDIYNEVKGFDEKITFGEDISYVFKAAKISRYGYIKQQFFYSTRRYYKDGRLATYVKYVLGYFYIVIFGSVTSNIFRYRFNHYKEESTKH